LRALAISNLAAGVFHGFSVGASQSRTTVNQDAGGRTQVASLVCVGVLIVFLLFLAPVLSLLPAVALGSILVFSGVHLVDLAAYRMLRRISTKAFYLSLLVTAGVLIVGVVPGILIGVMLSLVYVLGRLEHPTDIVLKEVPGTGEFHDVGDVAATETVPGVIAYRFYAPLFFANAEYFMKRVRSLVDASPKPVRWFLMDAQAVTDIDVTGADALAQLIEELRGKGIAFKLARANRPLRETLAHIGLGEHLAEATLFPSVHAAIAVFRREMNAAVLSEK
jgi:sulfate permease, SulP family